MLFMENPFEITAAKEKLMPLLGKAGLRWGDYTRCREGALDALEKDGLLVILDMAQYSSFSERQSRVMKAIANSNGEQLLVIPYESFMFPLIKAGSVAKKFPLIPLRFNGKHTLQELLREKMKEVTIDDVLVGYDWQSPTGNDKRFIVTTLVDCIKGHLLNTMIGEDVIKIKPYTEPEFTPGYGLMISAEGVPSLSDDAGYNFIIEGAMLLEKGKKTDMPEATFQLCTDHKCRKESYYKIKYGRKIILLGDRKMAGMRYGKERLECYHSVLAVKKAKKRVKMLHGLEMPDPFIEPSNKGTIRMFDATRKSIVYQDKEGYFHNMNETLSEILIWKYIGYANQKNRA